MWFYNVSRIEEIRGRASLLAALVERWRPKTHTFVLLVSNVTVILKDVVDIYDIPIDKEVVTG
ncbi:hypothetical protein AHAS_Ahas18G0154800 [Arachis hypogaea]